MIELRSLTGVGWEPLAAAFNAAFSDYIVPMSLTADGLAAMQRRRGYAADVSFGAFDRDDSRARSRSIIANMLL